MGCCVSAHEADNTTRQTPAKHTKQQEPVNLEPTDDHWEGMGNDASKPGGGDDAEGMTVHKTQVGRVRAVLGGKGNQRERLAHQGPKATASDYEFITVRLPLPWCRCTCSTDQVIPPQFPQGSLTNLLLFAKLDKFTQTKIVSETYERTVTAGEILIQQGDTGLAATQLFVVKSGKFEVGFDRD